MSSTTKRPVFHPCCGRRTQLGHKRDCDRVVLSAALAAIEANADARAILDRALGALHSWDLSGCRDLIEQALATLSAGIERA